MSGWTTACRCCVACCKEPTLLLWPRTLSISYFPYQHPLCCAPFHILVYSVILPNSKSSPYSLLFHLFHYLFSSFFFRLFHLFSIPNRAFLAAVRTGRSTIIPASHEWPMGQWLVSTVQENAGLTNQSRGGTDGYSGRNINREKISRLRRPHSIEATSNI